MPNNTGGVFPKLFPDIVIDKEYSRANPLYVLLYAIIFSAVVYVIKTFNVAPSSGIVDLAVVFIPGFIVHSFVPTRFRPFVYCLVFAACLLHVFSWGTAAVIIAILSGTVYVIFKDIKLRWKYLYLVLLGLALFFFRDPFRFYMPRLNVSIPFVATILMFRIIVLMYEVKYSKLEGNHWQKLSYFFCFPNLSFLLYPIIDYKAYIRNYYSASFNTICNKGVYYMMTGILLLLAHKYATYYFDVSYLGVHDIYTLLPYLLSKYIIVLKITGLLILGLSFLYMFGFNMPALFGNFFVATSFNDYWQKVNIYWKDFIVKIVYYPLYFKVRKKLKTGATTFCIIIAILSSWVFHVYQRFWMSGSVAFQLTDFLYWFLLALLVALDLYIVGLTTKNDKTGSSFKSKLVKGGGFVVVFATMLVLWFLWTSSNISTFFFIMSKGLRADASQMISVIITIALLIAGYALCLQAGSSYKTSPASRGKLQIAFSLVALCLICTLGVFKDRISGSKLMTIAMSQEKVSKDDKEKNETDYYAAVTNVKNNNWEVSMSWGDRRSLFGHIGIYSNDLVFQRLQPNKSVVFMGHDVSTNSYGYRDKEYALAKPPNTFRIALLGGSYEMGAGVNQDQVFEKIVEDSLNAYFKGNPKIEIMNFGMGSFTSVPQMEVFKTSVLQFHPDEVMVFYHTDELSRARRFFARYITNGVPLKYEYLLNLKTASGVRQSMSIEEVISRLNPYMRSMTGWCYSQIDSMARANNIKPIWIFLPTTSDELTGEELKSMKHIADTAGFNTFVLNDVYKGYEHDKIIVSDEDTHPNAIGHRLIANKLFNLLIDSATHTIPQK